MNGGHALSATRGTTWLARAVHSRAMLFFFAFIALIAAAVPAIVSAETGAVEVGNHLYETGKYVEAAQVYQQLVDQGVRDSVVYYNLGNAYYRQGEIGLAVLNYRRAMRLAPRDADIKVNLGIARSETSDDLDRGNPSALAAASGITNWGLTINETAVIAFVLWTLLAVSAGLYFAGGRRAREIGLYAAATVAVLVVLATVSLSARVVTERDRSSVIVIAEELEVHGGPGTQYSSRFKLNSGAEVRVIETRGSWARLSLPGGDLEGWVHARQVEPIAPGS